MFGIGSALIGGLASLFGMNQQARATDKAIAAQRLGYDYLLGNDLVQGAQAQGTQAQGLIGALLGLGGDQAAADAAFKQFQDSSGYQFRLGQGLGAIEGSQAAGGLLNSGATLKGLNDYGQGMASAEFQNYLGQLLGQQETGLGAAYNTASQGASAGTGIANATLQGASNQYNILNQGLGNVAAGIGYAVNPYSTNPSTGLTY